MWLVHQGPSYCCCLGYRNGFPSLGRLRQPHRTQRSSRLRVRAASESNEASKVDVNKLGVIPFEMDNETFQDVMAFAGPAPEVRVHRSSGITINSPGRQKLCHHNSPLFPDKKAEACYRVGSAEAPQCLQRTNGRIAMIAFAGAAAAEVATGKGIVEQAAEHPVLITFMVFLLTVAGFMPKLASGVSLSTLLDASGALKTAYGSDTSVSTSSSFPILAYCAASVCFCIS